MMRSRLMILWIGATLALLGACAGGNSNISGTRIEDSEDNRKLLKIIDEYRLAVEKKDIAALMAMASKQYWEDGGTPAGIDDYGYDGLRDVLKSRFQAAESIRYSMKYMRIRRQASRAFVEVLIDASYTLRTHRGEERRDMKEQNELILEWDGQRWLFVAGM